MMVRRATIIVAGAFSTFAIRISHPPATSDDIAPNTDDHHDENHSTTSVKDHFSLDGTPHITNDPAWHVNHVNCATSPFAHVCAATEFCYKNLQSTLEEPAHCEEKRMPGSACGAFDRHYWGVACDPLETNSGDIQRFSCQETPQPSTNTAAAVPATDMMGSHDIMSGMCLPCCDKENAQTDCGKMPDCPDDFSHEMDTIVVAEDTQVCVAGKKGDQIDGCPEGPVKLQKDIDVCITAKEFQSHPDFGPPELEHIAEELIPGSAEQEVHDKMQTGALFKAGVCAPVDGAGGKAPPTSKPTPPPSTEPEKAAPAPPAKAAPAPPAKAAPPPPPPAKAAPPPPPAKAAPPKPKGKPVDTSAADNAAKSVGVGPSAQEQIPDTTAATEADAINAKAEALSASLLARRK